jgi:hypothetical protein
MEARMTANGRSPGYEALQQLGSFSYHADLQLLADQVRLVVLLILILVFLCLVSAIGTKQWRRVTVKFFNYCLAIFTVFCFDRV